MAMETAAEARYRIAMKTLKVIGASLLLLLVSGLVIGFFVSMSVPSKLDKDYDLSCNPSIYVQEFSVPAFLSIRNNSYLNSSIIVGLEFKRGAAMPHALATYSDLYLNLYYGEGPSFAVANGTVPHFRMGDMKNVSYTMEMEAPRLPWEDAFSKVFGGSPVHFRLELVGKFKPLKDYEYDYPCSTSWLDIQVQAGVSVDASAHMLSNTPIIFNF